MKNARFRLTFALIALTAVGSTALNGLRTEASSHREAPLLTDDPKVDCTDVFAFVSPDQPGMVTLIANYIPFEEPGGGPNYFNLADNALYEIHVDNDGDAVEDITYRFQFTTTINDPSTFLYNTGPITFSGGTYQNLNIQQRYTLTRIDGDRRTGTATVLGQDLLVPPNNVGPKSIADYPSLVTPAIVTLSDTSKVFAGPRDDPFFIQLGRTFDLLNIDAVLPGGLDSQCNTATSVDYLAGFNVHSLVLQVPIERLTSNGTRPTSATDPAAILGVWSTSSRPQVQLRRTRPQPTQGREGSFFGGAFVQVSRLGNPLVNEVVIPLRDKDLFNNSEPKDDAQFLQYVEDPILADIMRSLFPSLTIPNPPRQDLVQVYLTGLPGVNEKGVPAEYLRLNTAVAPIGTSVSAGSRLGALAGEPGFPNGRRLIDDVVDISLRAVAGVLTDPSTPELGDTVCENDVPFLNTFPYLATPHDGVNRIHENP